MIAAQRGFAPRGLAAACWVALVLAGCGRTPLKLSKDGGLFDDAGVDAMIDAGRCAFDCDDLVDCTIDRCDEATVACVSTPDSTLCPPNQICVPGRGCARVPCSSDDACADSFFCNGEEICLNGFCAGGRPVECFGSVCEAAWCDELLRSCVYTARDDDGDGFGPLFCGDADCDDNNRNVSPAARESCSDGIDNDCNFAVDCDDAACASDSACNAREDCNNNFDDDFDGLVDCDDPDCARHPRCMMTGVERNCRNNVDDDNDGLIDCVDPDCFPVPACQMQRENCRDGFDNDGDGAVDCADADCAVDPNCRNPSCPNVDLGSRVGLVARGTTNGEGNDSSAPCLSDGHTASDVTFSWRAPRDGTWVFDTRDSVFDTVLYIQDRGCTGPTIACVDDAGSLQARLVVPLRAGQSIVIVIDGYASSSGNYFLRINPLEPEFGRCGDGVDNDGDGATDCGDPDCFNDRLCAAGNEFGRCADGIDNDFDGLFDCRDPDCFSDWFCAFPPSEAGLCDDGIDNDFDGAIDCADGDCAMTPGCLQTCPNLNLGSRTGVVARGTTSGNGNDSTPWCVSSNAPDVTFLWRAPRTAIWRIDTRDSSFDTVLYLQDGGCNGPALACNDDNGSTRARIDMALSAGQTILIVLDGWSSSEGNYVLRIEEASVLSEVGRCTDNIDNDNDGARDCQDSDCFNDPACFVPMSERGRCTDGIDNDRDNLVDCQDFDCANDPACFMANPCPDHDLGSRLGAPVASGDTTGRGNDQAGTCIGSAAPDVSYLWRAPATGRWVFDTDGSAHPDTGLYVLDGTCNGRSLACDDDSGEGYDSRITLTLMRGQVVVIVVDGYSSNAGSYVLNISRLITNERGFCADFIDNDGDEAIDCADSDCFDDIACDQNCVAQETGLSMCTDGRDNDCDGRFDCDDSDCLALLGNECCNGVDDNGDGIVDLLACACRTSSQCGPISTPIGVVAGTCWSRLGACGPDCSTFPGDIPDFICQNINPGWRCQRTTGQCVPSLMP